LDGCEAEAEAWNLRFATKVRLEDLAAESQSVARSRYREQASPGFQTPAPLASDRIARRNEDQPVAKRRRLSDQKRPVSSINPPSPFGSGARDSVSWTGWGGRVAISLFSVGAAVAASVLAMAIRNQPRVMPAEETAHASLAPLFGPGLVGLQVALRR
jgi:hypothetical protein